MTITVTEEDLKTLEAIPAAFMNNVLSNSGMTREEAYDAGRLCRRTRQFFWLLFPAQRFLKIAALI